MDHNFYDILHSHINDPIHEIKKQYKKLLVENHPDKGRCQNSSLFLAIQQAWDTLKDPLKRQSYNKSLQLSSISDRCIVYDNIDLSDMNQIDDTKYTYDCRCGGSFVYSFDNSLTSSSSLLLNCTDCSLFLKISVP